MERLTAKRPIQYMGRTYDVGEVLPAYDSAMVAAWLAAGSAEWYDQERVENQAAVVAATLQDVNNALVADFLSDMGVRITDDAGVFVGEDNLEEQIRAAITGGQQDGAEGENGKSAGAPEMLTGHLDAAQLERMNKPDLIKLAGDIGVDISTAKNNAERAAILAAVPVQAQKDDGGSAR